MLSLPPGVNYMPIYSSYFNSPHNLLSGGHTTGTPQHPPSYHLPHIPGLSRWAGQGAGQKEGPIRGTDRPSDTQQLLLLGAADHGRSRRKRSSGSRHTHEHRRSSGSNRSGSEKEGRDSDSDSEEEVGSVGSASQGSGASPHPHFSCILPRHRRNSSNASRRLSDGVVSASAHTLSPLNQLSDKWLDLTAPQHTEGGHTQMQEACVGVASAVDPSLSDSMHVSSSDA